jgi:hypothetical protein
MAFTWDFTLWLDDVQTTDHSEIGQARLIWQYRGDKPRMQAWLAAYLESLQTLEDTAIQVMANRWPLTAEGEQLDILGKIVGQERGALTDDQYRLFILARILANRSKGRASDLGEILEVLGFPTIDIWEHYPAEIHVSVAGADYGELVVEILDDAKAGGVMLRFTFSDEDEDDVFQMAATADYADIDVNSGFGDPDPAIQTAGGYLSGGRVR